MDELIEQVRQWIDEAERVVVLTGAGISTDSGIPDFRGPNGVWTKNPAAEKASNIRYYLADPEVRKAAWRSRVETFGQQREPNPGHLALVHLERRGKLHGLVTQNVDGLHLKAGNDPAKVVEVHGTVSRWMCMGCGAGGPMEDAIERVRQGEDDPACRDCGGIVKSATISFGQNLDPAVIDKAERLAAEADLLLAVGSTLGVYPAAYVVPIAKEAGARLVILNNDETPFDRVADAVLHASISDVLPRLVGAPG